MRRSPGSDIGGVTLLVTIIVGGINVTSGNRCVCVSHNWDPCVKSFQHHILLRKAHKIPQEKLRSFFTEG